MSLLEHLEELRRRLIHSVIYIRRWILRRVRLSREDLQPHAGAHHLRAQEARPATQLVIHNPIDGFNMYLKISFMGGCILASPFVLYQVWLFISPGLYQNEKRYVMPFMIGDGRPVSGRSILRLSLGFSRLARFSVHLQHEFRPLIEVNEYTDLFLTVILGLGITFELPILVLFLSLFGIVSPRFLWKNIRYAILIIFIIAAIITPTPDVLTMCVFAAPMLFLYLISIGVSYMVHPATTQKSTGELSCGCVGSLIFSIAAGPALAQLQQRR